MKLVDIIHVFSVSCFLVFFCVSSQPGCSRGWFGHQCKYKCRCENTSCDVNGSCIQPYICEGGWFGSACQYADLAYRTVNLTEITDDNDGTCNDANAGDRITIPFDVSFVFTWLRIHVRDQGSDAVKQLNVTFNFNSSSVPCPVWKKQAVSKTIVDMHCNISQTIDEMTLVGQAVPHLCSVYVSGGRNVAVKETAWQSDDYEVEVGNNTYSLYASRAVDANTNTNIFDLSCAHTNNTATWTLTLSRQRSVNRFVLYNRIDKAYRLRGFNLESFDSANRSVFKYEDETTSAKQIYTIVNSPIPVQMVVVTAHNTENIVTLCEVELYGDSICDPHHYGRDCEHTCSCANNETCFVSTGGCPSGCAAGFSGESCMGGCKVGTFGMNCSQSCNPKCAPSGKANVTSCDTKTGTCLKGCQSGLSGAMCTEECKAGTFGMNCNESCSPKCTSSGKSDVSSCDTKTGACLKGCQIGFFGAMCENSIPSAVLASTGFPFELILALSTLVSAMFVAAFCLKKKSKKGQAGEGPIANAELE